MKITKYFDHTLLKQDATRAGIITLCEQAKQYDFASVCVNPTWVKIASEVLKGTDVKVCTVVGFPLGATTPETKAFETKNALENGATEIDMVINVGLVKEHKYELVTEDIAAVVKAANGNVVKVILETCLLSKSEIIEACKCAVEAGANFVKTSTGFSTGGATIEDVTLMKKTVGEHLEVKASGGVRTLADFEAMLAAGATRIGTSNAITILQGQEVKDNSY